jgi:membrane-bound serine protease (ClpP class)
MNEVFLNPNFAYLILVTGLMLAAMAVFTPGTGLAEVGAFFLLILAAWEVYNLPINIWALALLLLAVVFFVLAFRKTRPYLFLSLSIVAVVVGSAFMFRGETWSQPAVNPILALIVSLLSGGFLWIGTNKTLEAIRRIPSHSLEALLGASGEAKSQIGEDGSVQVAGELWSARSENPIPEGTQIRVVGREGFILQVEPKSTDSKSPEVDR